MENIWQIGKESLNLPLIQAEDVFAIAILIPIVVFFIGSVNSTLFLGYLKPGKFHAKSRMR